MIVFFNGKFNKEEGERRKREEKRGREERKERGKRREGRVRVWRAQRRRETITHR